jgi:WD40 repeat protein/DNA-directed RNA polymerase specialized sigma24 family protein
MQNKEEMRRDYLHRVNPSRLEDAEATELAFRMQNSVKDDPEMLGNLIDHYEVDLYRWVRAYLYYQSGIEPVKDEVFVALQRTFAYAISHADQFHGQASLFNWLISICYRLIRRTPFFTRLGKYFRGINLTRGRSVTEKDITWKSLGNVPEKFRTPLLLKYLFNLGPGDISNVLNLQDEEVHRRLSIGRKVLMPGPELPEMDKVIQAYIDGLYDDEPEQLNLIMEHIDSCDECQSYLRSVNYFENSLTEGLKDHWKVPALEKKDRDELAYLALLRIQLTKKTWKLRVNVRQAAWIAGLLSIFGILAIVFVRLTPSETEFPQAISSPTPALPPIINMQPVLTNLQGENSIAQAPQFIDPALSTDGKWVVFSEIKLDSTTQQMTFPTITLYNREDGTFRTISENNAALSLPWVWWDLAPSISADGQRVVYANSSNDSRISGYSCHTQGQQACLDIFLYDQATHATTRITQAIYGGAADGDSLAPTISGDGNWIAFWSAADNLVDVNKDICQRIDTGIICLYIYLFDVQNGKLQQIPVRIKPGNDFFGVDRISLSADGRFVGFTLLQSSQSAGVTFESPAISLQAEINTTRLSTAIPEIQQSSEAVVYDQQTDAYELENVALDGTAGNGPSSSPMLSADGRFVAFVSSASNLLQGDLNNASDVFIRDRQTGSVELASVSSAGQQGNNDSGIVVLDRGFYSLDLSSDGKYVVFQSKANNLGSAASNDCRQPGIFSCIYLYVHDLQTGATDLIASDANQGFSFFPTISADGHWISFSQYSYYCSSQQFVCSNVMMYDRQRIWLSNLTNFNQATISLPWSYSTSLTLPWQSWESQGLTFSPDGKLIAVGGYDSKIRVWALHQGAIGIQRASQEATIATAGTNVFTTLAFSQDNHWLAAGTNTGVVYIWSLPDNRLLYSLKDQGNPIKKIVFSEDGSNLIISTIYDIRIWTIGYGQLYQENTISFGETPIYALDISPEGNLLATGRGDGTVWLQNLPTGKLIGRLGGQQVSVFSLAFSPDGSLLAARSVEGKINLWKVSYSGADSPLFTLLNTIQSYEYVGELVFSPDNKYLATTGLVGAIGLWGVADGKIYSLTPSNPVGMVYGVAFSESGNVLAAMFENEIELWGLPPEYKSAYFTQATQDIFVNSPPEPLSSLYDVEKLSGDYIGGMQSLDQAASMLQFPLIVPNHLPETLDYLGATVNLDGSVWLRYITYENQSFQSILYIYERMLGFSTPPTMTIGSSASIISIRIQTNMGPVDADYVQGDWQWSIGYIPPSDTSNTAQGREAWSWDNSSLSQRLRWQQAGIFIAMYDLVNDTYLPSSINQSRTYRPENSGLLSQDDMIQIAAGMQWYK